MTKHTTEIMETTYKKLTKTPTHKSAEFNRYQVYRNKHMLNLYRSIVRTFNGIDGKHLYELAMIDMIYNAVMYDNYVVSTSSPTICEFTNSTKYRAIQELLSLGVLITVPNHYKGNQYVILTQINIISSCVKVYMTENCPWWIVGMSKFKPPKNRTEWKQENPPF